MSEQKVVVITGGSDGIGRALCFEYGRKGYAVVFTGRSEEKLHDVSEQLDSASITNLACQLDAASDADNKQLVDNAIAKFGRIDVLICNAGISMRILFQEISMEIFEKLMQVNFMGVVSLVHHALPHLIASKGHIVGISSVNGRRATPARSAYAASKYALEGFFETIRMELRPQQVRVLVVCPGFTRSNMRKSSLMPDGKEQGETKLKEGRFMEAETVARKVYRAMVRKKRDLVLTPEGKLVVFANKFIPAIVDDLVFRFMARKPDSPFYKGKRNPKS